MIMRNTSIRIKIFVAHAYVSYVTYVWQTYQL